MMAFDFRCAVIAASALLAAPALAVDLPGQATDSVRVQRAWLASDSAATTDRSLRLLGRAAMEACGASTFSVRDYQDAVRASPCWQASMSDALARLGNPALSDAFHRRAQVEVAAAAGGAERGMR